MDSKFTPEYFRNYKQIAKQAKNLTAQEMEMRKEIAAAAAADMIKKGDLEEGTIKGKFTHSFVWEDDCTITISFSLGTSKKVDEEALEEDYSVLTEAEQEVFKKKESFSIDNKKLEALRELAEDNPEISFRCEEYISEKPSTPTISEIDIE